jgi:threonine dehydrogenase-like Zn-dependent dehydrogenase
MSEWRRIRSLGVEREGQIYYFEYDEGPPGEHQFRVDTLYTGLSAGTELTFYKGTNPYLHHRWDEAFGIFDPHHPTVHYPVPFLGYMEVGLVTESRTPHVREGEILGMNYGHKTGHIAHAHHDLFVRLPEGLDPVLGIYAHQMGPICVNGLLHAAAEASGPHVTRLGEGVEGRRVLVMGAGVIGLLTGLLALHHGAAAVAVADTTPERLAAARGLGLLAIDENTERGGIEAWRWCKENWHHGGSDRGADVVFQCRATDRALATAFKALRPQGCVIDLAFYQGGAEAVRLGEEFHHNGLSLRCAQINRVPRGLAPAWPRRRLCDETVNLLGRYARPLRDHVITDIIPYDEAGALFSDLAARRRHILQAVFQVREVPGWPRAHAQGEAHEAALANGRAETAAVGS